MTVHRIVAFSSIFALTLPASMAREKENAFRGVQQSVRERTGKAVRWEEDQAAREQALQDARQLLRKPGQARIARGEATYRQARDRFEALAIDVRSQIRELRDELTNKREIARFYQEELLPNERRILNLSLMNYNAMTINNFELFTTKAEEARTEREYIEAVRDYWITRAELERAVGGNLRPRQSAEGKLTPISDSKATR